MKKLRIELQLIENISLQLLLQKITDLIPEIDDLGTIINLELITIEDINPEIDSTDSASIDRNYEDK